MKYIYNFIWRKKRGAINIAQEIIELYDMGSPRCFPVQHDAYQRRFAHVGVVGGEVPNLSLYNDT